MNRTDRAATVFTPEGPPTTPVTDQPPAHRSDQQTWAAQASGLRKTYGRTVALDAVDLGRPCWFGARPDRAERLWQDHLDPAAARVGPTERGQRDTAR